MIFQCLVMNLPRFFDLKDHNYVPSQKLKNLRQHVVAINMMNKCAKFHKDRPSDKKVKLNLPSAIELSETAVLCTTLCRNPKQLSNFGGTFDQLFLWIFLWNFHKRCLSISSIPWCKKVKNDQKLKSRVGLLRTKIILFPKMWWFFLPRSSFIISW